MLTHIYVVTKPQLEIIFQQSWLTVHGWLLISFWLSCNSVHGWLVPPLSTSWQGSCHSMQPFMFPLITCLMWNWSCQGKYSWTLAPSLQLIVLFHKSQCALRYLDLMSKIQNISGHRSLGTCLTVAANEQNGDWPAPVSRVSVQPVIGWLKYEVARQWSHRVHRPRPHGNVTLPMRS